MPRQGPSASGCRPPGYRRRAALGLALPEQCAQPTSRLNRRVYERRRRCPELLNCLDRRPRTSPHPRPLRSALLSSRRPSHEAAQEAARPADATAHVVSGTDAPYDQPTSPGVELQVIDASHDVVDPPFATGVCASSSGIWMTNPVRPGGIERPGPRTVGSTPGVDAVAARPPGWASCLARCGSLRGGASGGPGRPSLEHAAAVGAPPSQDGVRALRTKGALEAADPSVPAVVGKRATATFALRTHLEHACPPLDLPPCLVAARRAGAYASRRPRPLSTTPDPRATCGYRPHRPLDQQPPTGRTPPPTPIKASLRPLRRDRLGGLLHEYVQVA